MHIEKYFLNTCSSGHDYILEMWNIYLKPLSFVRFSRRTLTTNNNSIIDNIIKRLSIDFKNEFNQLQNNENENSIDRIQYLKTTLHTMNIRDKILQDIDETKKLSNGKKNNIPCPLSTEPHQNFPGSSLG